MTSTRKAQPQLGRPLHKAVEATLPIDVWKALLKRMAELIREEILSSPIGFDLPLSLGTLRVVKQKVDRKKPFVNFKSLCLGKYELQANRHSFGHVYKVAWLTLPTMRVPAFRIYQLKANRALNRALATRIFAGQDYLPAPDNGSLLTYRS